MKLNVGSAWDKIDGFTNIDGLDWDGNTDVIHDLNITPYPFYDNNADEIRCVETLEHISWRNTAKVLGEFYRILRPDGKLFIQVPDCGKAMEYYFRKEICTCVPHKADKGGFVADDDCLKCMGRGKINPVRWMMSFNGAQKHKFDAHLNIFTKDIMTRELVQAGFKNIEFGEDINKLKVNCIK